MKIRKEHFEHIRKQIHDHLRAKPDIPENYRNGNFYRAERCKDVDKRFRWDMLYAAVSSAWICENLYPYLNDDHIDTALRNIVPNLDLLTVNFNF